MRSAAAGTTTPEAEAIQKIINDFGPIVTPKDAPSLYPELGKMFDRLSDAHATLNKDSVMAVNSLKIVDSPIQNAFVITLKDDGVRKANNLVVITSGLINRMFARADVTDTKPFTQKELREGMVRIAGVLSHELAHPFDKYDTEGIQKNFGRLKASQAMEIRADSEGALIAKKAGYPAESVYEGLSRLFAGPARDTNALASALSTHPDDALRLSTQRLLLTGVRYQQGTAQPLYPEALKSGLAQDIQKFDLYSRKWKHEPPRSLNEIVQRIRKLDTSEAAQAYSEIEFNRLVLDADVMLDAKKGAPLNPEEQKAFNEFVDLLSPSGPNKEFRVYSREAKSASLTADNLSQAYQKIPDHETFVNRLPAYRESSHLERLKNLYFKKANPDSGMVRHEITRLKSILPAKETFSTFGEQIDQGLKDLLTSGDADMRTMMLGHFEEDRSMDFRVRLADRLHRNVLPQLEERHRRALELGSAKFTNRQSILLPTYGRGFSSIPRGPGILTDRHLLAADPRMKELQELHQSSMKRIWDNRGKYGILDFFIGFDNIDWETIWATLGIDPKTGRGQLIQEVKKFTRSQEFPKLLAELQADLPGGFASMNFKEMGMMKDVPPQWMDQTLWPYLSGELNEGMKAQPELKDFAKSAFLRHYRSAFPKRFDDNYVKLVTSALDAKASAGVPVTLEDLAAIAKESKTAAQVTGARPFTHAQAIEASKLKRENKDALLRRLFVDKAGNDEDFYSTGMRWLLEEGDPDQRKIMNLLKDRKILRSSPEAFQILDGYFKAKEGPFASGANQATEYYLKSVGYFKDSLLKDTADLLSSEKNAAARKNSFLRIVKALTDPNPGKYQELESINTREFRDLKEGLINLSDQVPLEEADRVSIFNHLTGTGPTTRTDAFFKKSLGEVTERPLTHDTAAWLKSGLKSNRFSSSSLRIDLTRKLVTEEIESLASKPADPTAVNNLIDRVNLYVPNGSLKKDDFLEEIGWKLRLDGKELIGLIEDQKSYNWKKANPMLINAGSVLSSQLGEMSAQARHDLIQYLVNPEKGSLPPNLVDEVEDLLVSQGMLAVAKGESTIDEVRKAAKKGAEEFRYRLEAAVIDATPNERIPLFEMVLKTGKDNLFDAADFPLNISRRYLGYAANSQEEKLLVAFLRTVPAHERSVSIAYLLSQAGQDKSSVKALFEVFQTVGIKFGQMSSIWKLFGEEVAQETKNLKDSARPLTKVEIGEILKRDLEPVEYAKIKSLKKVLGGASVKTAVLVELQDGRESVALVRRPFIEDQIKSNLDLSRKFLAELKKSNVDVPQGMFSVIIDDLESQLVDEIKFTDEVGKIREAKKIYTELNSTMKDKLQGYKFAVPDVIDEIRPRENILFLEKADGMSWDKLLKRNADEARSIVGPAIAESGLQTLTRHGAFNADPHGGNFMIDPKTKTINVLDLGQVDHFSKTWPWKSDDRLLLGQFLKAVNENDSKALAKASLAMRVPGTEAISVDDLAAKLQKVLSETRESPMSDRMIALMNGLADQKIKLQRKFSFGALKGLLLLHGEHYVPEDRFADIVSSEFKQVFLKKVPALALEKISGADCKLHFQKLLRGALGMKEAAN